MKRHLHFPSSWALALLVATCLCQRTGAKAATDVAAPTPCDRMWNKLDLHEGGLFAQYYRAWKAMESSNDIKGYFATLPDGSRRLLVKRSDYGNVETWTFNRSSGELTPQGTDKDGVTAVCQPPDAAVVNWKSIAPEIGSKVKLQCRLSGTNGVDPAPKWIILALASSEKGSAPILAALESRAGKATRCELPK